MDVEVVASEDIVRWMAVVGWWLSRLGLKRLKVVVDNKDNDDAVGEYKLKTCLTRAVLMQGRMNSMRRGCKEQHT